MWNLRGRMMAGALTVAAMAVGGCASYAAKVGSDYLNIRNTPSAMEAVHGIAAGADGAAAATGSSNSEARATAPTLLADVAPDPAAAAIHREIIYQAGLAMVVPDIRAAEQAVQRVAESAGGYLQELDGPAITVRIPAAKFDAALAAAEKLGEVTQRHIQASDVTEEMRDLAIRLENAQDVRQRLAELVEKSQKMEDTIKLEQELERVTQTIELLKGKMQFMQSQIALSTIRVTFNSPLPQKTAVMELPFAWVRDLGDGVVAGVTENAPDTSRFWKRNDRFTLPEGFVRYYERDHVTEAMSGNEIVIKLHRQDNYDGGTVGFWNLLARRVLVESRAIALSRESDIQLDDKTPARWLVGTKDLGGKKQGYIVGIAATKRYVYTFEAWGENQRLEREIPALETAFKTLDVKHW